MARTRKTSKEALEEKIEKAEVDVIAAKKKYDQATANLKELLGKWESVIWKKNYIWQGEYGKRSHLKASFKELLKEQDSSSLEMLAIFVNNNPYNFEFYIAVVYDIPKEEHVEKMIGLFENAGLVLRNDLTFFMFMNSMKDRRFNSCAFLGAWMKK